MKGMRPKQSTIPLAILNVYPPHLHPHHHTGQGSPTGRGISRGLKYATAYDVFLRHKWLNKMRLDHLCCFKWNERQWL